MGQADAGSQSQMELNISLYVRNDIEDKVKL